MCQNGELVYFSVKKSVFFSKMGTNVSFETVQQYLYSV